MLFRLSLGLALVTSLTSCRSSIATSNADNRRTSKISDSLFPVAMASEASLPECGGANEGMLVYAELERSFSVCASGTWKAIDLRGDKGDKGDKGENGATGPTGARGPAGATSDVLTELQIQAPATSDVAEISVENQSTAQYSGSMITLLNREVASDKTRWTIRAEKEDGGAANGKSNFQIRRGSADGSTEVITPFLIDDLNNVILQAGYKNGTAHQFGRVAIGTNAPEAKLDVRGHSEITSGSHVTALYTSTYDQAASTAANTDVLIRRFETNVGSGTQYVLRAEVNNNSIFEIEPNGYASILSSNGGSLQFDPTDGTIELASGNNTGASIDFKGSGNLGADYRGRITYEDGHGFYVRVNASNDPSIVVHEEGRIHMNDVVRLTPRATSPGSPQTGDLYVTTDAALCFWNGSAWERINGTGTCP